MQTKIPCVLMRGGTSKGPYFLASDLPSDPELRDKVLLAVMGSPDIRQIDGVGGADPLTSKVAIVSAPSTRDDCDVDYLFAQVVVDDAVVDISPNCGNMLAGVGPFAIEQGIFPATDGETVVRIHMVNSGDKAVPTITISRLRPFRSAEKRDPMPKPCAFAKVSLTITSSARPGSGVS